MKKLQSYLYTVLSISGVSTEALLPSALCLNPSQWSNQALILSSER